MGKAVIRLVLILIPAYSFSWDSREHEFLGAKAFTRACEIANLDSMISREVFAAFCGRIETKSKLYGEATWISGDYIDDNRALAGNKLGALEVMESNLHYAILATENESHFHPSVESEWLKQSSAALEVAGKYGKNANEADNLMVVNLVFYQNAYADHFLQDAFATGHFGFNRKRTSSSAAKINHDFWSSRGRFIRNSERTWFGFGDGCLDTAFAKCYSDRDLQMRNMEYILEANQLTLLACMHTMSGATDRAKTEIQQVNGLLPDAFFVDTFFDKDVIQRNEIWPEQLDTSRGSWQPAIGMVKTKTPAFSIYLFASAPWDRSYIDVGFMPYFRVFHSLFLGGGIGYQFYSPKNDSILDPHLVGIGSVLLLTDFKAYSTKPGFSLNIQNRYRNNRSGPDGVVFLAAHGFVGLEFGRYNPFIGIYLGKDLTGGHQEVEFGVKCGVAINWMHWSYRTVGDELVISGE